MKIILTPIHRLVLALILITSAQAHAARPEPQKSYVAFSLREAEQAMAPGSQSRPQAEALGGITHLAGLVHDEAARDLIIVGCHMPGHPAVSLDDLVVALRSALRLGKAPLVSLDPTAETPRTGKFRAVFDGGIAGTSMGRDMLACDVLMKQMALGKVRADLWNVSSYVDLLSRKMEQGDGEDRILSRFWFKSRQPTVAFRDGVYVVLSLTVGIDTEVLEARIKGQVVTNLSTFNDGLGNQFASRVEASLEDMAVEFPVLRKARQFIALVSLAEGVRQLSNPPVLDFWLDRYPVRRVATEESFDRIEVRREIVGRSRVLTVTGGFDASPYLVRLKRGHTSAFKEVVLKSRPARDSLTWTPPLHGWSVPGAGDIEPHDQDAAPPGRAPGFSVDASVTGPGRVNAPAYFPKPVEFTPPPLRYDPPTPRFLNSEPSSFKFSNIGGVALTATAAFEGRAGRANFNDGGFSLVADGQNARLDPQSFRRFLTGLWSVYYSDTDPGISIDPIAKGVKQHLVRYIGNVMNSDLGRVMREADYLMKRWAVGTDRPAFPGYRNPDDIAGRRGVAYVGAGSRFWFVPENLRFKQADGLLLFQDGRMTLQTEYLFGGKHGQGADPANDEWARWFTKNYAVLAAANPVLEELFDYAKLVALAKHLKQSGTPMLWFLLANKDQAMTEDSPGTVNELVKDSEHFDGLKIMGGVQLVAPPQFIFDEKAQTALRQGVALAASNLAPRSTAAITPMASPFAQPFSLKLEQKDYSILPQQSLSCGRDRHGNRYQTDLAVREEGRPGLELVRWFSNSESAEGDFGRGWRLLVPYRIQPDTVQKREFMNVRVPERMRLRNLLTGREEVLQFSPALPLQGSSTSTNGSRVAGWAPANVANSEAIALFLMADGSFSLKDKLNNRFRFDAGGYLTHMFLGHASPICIEYADADLEVLESGGFKLLPGTERVAFASAFVPRALTLVDRANDRRDTYVFTTRHQVAGYEPADPARSRSFIAIMAGGTFRLESEGGCLLDFDGSGSLKAAQLNGRERLFKSLRQGNQSVEFQYLLHPTGRAFISSLQLRNDDGKLPGEHLRYRYDDTGRLYQVERPTQLTALSRSTAPAR